MATGDGDIDIQRLTAAETTLKQVLAIVNRNEAEISQLRQLVASDGPLHDKVKENWADLKELGARQETGLHRTELSIRDDLNKTTPIRDDLNRMGESIRGDLNQTAASIRDELHTTTTTIRDDLNKIAAALRKELTESRESFRSELHGSDLQLRQVIDDKVAKHDDRIKRLERVAYLVEPIGAVILLVIAWALHHYLH
jgi:hypothetical protein